MIQETHLFKPFDKTPISVISEAGVWNAPFELNIDDATLKKM